MAKVEKKTRPSKQKEKRDEKKDKSGKELKKELDNDLETALNEFDDPSARLEILLTQVLRELKKIKDK